MNHLETFREINTFFFDVDGVLTNNEVILLESGKLMHKMNVRDGFALRRAVEEGYRIVILTRSRSEALKDWLLDHGIRDIYLSVINKLEIFEDVVHAYELDTDRILYMGDDLPDLEAMQSSGVAACPSDATQEILKSAQFVSSLKGGQGCVREVIEKVLTLQGRW